MLTRHAHLILLAAMLASASGCGGLRPATRADARVELCALIERPSAYSGRRIEVRAKIRGANHYAAVLYDDGCAQSVVTLDVPEGSQDRVDVAGVLKQLWVGYPEPQAQTAEVEVSGRFEFAPQDVPSRYIVVRQLRSATSEPRD